MIPPTRLQGLTFHSRPAITGAALQAKHTAAGRSARCTCVCTIAVKSELGYETTNKPNPLAPRGSRLCGPLLPFSRLLHSRAQFSSNSSAPAMAVIDGDYQWTVRLKDFKSSLKFGKSDFTYCLTFICIISTT